MKNFLILLVLFVPILLIAQTPQTSEIDIFNTIGDIFARFDKAPLWQKIAAIGAILNIVLNLVPTTSKMLISRIIDFLKTHDTYITNILKQALMLFNSIVPDRKNGGSAH